MIIALLTALLLGGGGEKAPEIFGKEHQEAVQFAIDNEEHAAAVVAEMRAAQKLSNSFTKDTQALLKRWRNLDAAPDSGRAELAPLLAETDDLRAKTLESFADSIFRMREKATPEEWAAVAEILTD